MVHLPYSPERVEKIKTVAGRRWHIQEKHWTVPHDDKAVERLLQLFSGEQVLLAPGLGPPQRSSIQPEVSAAAAEDIQALHKVLRSAVRSRHFSPSTEAIYASWAERKSVRCWGKWTARPG